MNMLFSSTVALGGHSLCLAASKHRIFASSWHWVCRYCVGLPQHRIFASSQLRLSRFSETLSAASHLRIFATSPTKISWNPLRYFGDSGDSGEYIDFFDSGETNNYLVILVIPVILVNTLILLTNNYLVILDSGDSGEYIYFVDSGETNNYFFSHKTML